MNNYLRGQQMADDEFKEQEKDRNLHWITGKKEPDDSRYSGCGAHNRGHCSEL